MKFQLKWKVIISIIVLVLLVVGILIILKHKETKIILIEQNAPVESIERNVYSDPNNRFSFSYSKELGSIIEFDYGSGLDFNDTYDSFSMGSFGLWISTKIATEQGYIDYLSSLDDEFSTGDYTPSLSGAGWDAERLLLANNSNSEGDIPCLGDSQGVYQAVLCQIRKIGGNTFLVKYSKDSYKGESIIKEYIIYNKDIRYSFGRGKGLTFASYSEENSDPNMPQSQEYILGTVENLRNHALSRNEILVEDMLSTLTFK